MLCEKYIDLVMILVAYTFVWNLLSHSCQFIVNHTKEGQNFMMNHGTDICATPVAYTMHYIWLHRTWVAASSGLNTPIPIIQPLYPIPFLSFILCLCFHLIFIETSTDFFDFLEHLSTNFQSSYSWFRIASFQQCWIFLLQTACRKTGSSVKNRCHLFF